MFTVLCRELVEHSLIFEIERCHYFSVHKIDKCIVPVEMCAQMFFCDRKK